MSDKGATNWIANWVIALGVAGALFIWWASSGFPGVGDIGQDIYDGNWTCYNGGEGGVGRLYGPSLVVENGAIVRAYHFDFSSGSEYSAPYTGVKILSPTKLSLQSTYGIGPDDLYPFTCEKD